MVGFKGHPARAAFRFRDKGRFCIRAHRLFALAFGVLFLAGCAQRGMDDLQAYIHEISLRPGGQVAPLPEVMTFKTFVYRADDLSDPFSAWSKKTSSVAQNTPAAKGIRPNVERKSEQLEEFPLDALKMIGSLEYGGQKWAIVKAPDGLVYRVRVGNYMGQNYGRVNAVTDARIELVEIVPDGLGGWHERKASLALNE